MLVGCNSYINNYHTLARLTLSAQEIGVGVGTGVGSAGFPITMGDGVGTTFAAIGGATGLTVGATGMLVGSTGGAVTMGAGVGSTGVCVGSTGGGRVGHPGPGVGEGVGSTGAVE